MSTEIPYNNLTETQRHALTVLNRALAADEKAIRELCNHRVPVNSPALEDTPVVCLVDENRCVSVGLIGILGGILNTPGCRLAATYEDDGSISGFSFIGPESVVEPVISGVQDPQMDPKSNGCGGRRGNWTGPSPCL